YKVVRLRLLPNAVTVNVEGAGEIVVNHSTTDKAKIQYNDIFAKLEQVANDKLHQVYLIRTA
ncbi:hypothetical protein, partial [Escherichia coli]|uniref:hypothetical protein n=1 Tax=Escherichia coli TaxID=562 RepID=UPI0013B362BC